MWTITTITVNKVLEYLQTCKRYSGSRSMAGMQTTETLMSIYATCEMHNINPFEFFLDHLNGDVTETPLPKSMPVITV